MQVSRQSSAGIWWGTLAGLIMLCLLGYVDRERILAGENDFVQLYTGARLSGTPALYDIAANERIHAEVLHKVMPSVYYSRPPFYAFLLRPLGWLPFKTAYAVFQSASLLALIGFVALWTPRCRELPMFASLSIPVVSALTGGQDVFFALLAVALAIETVRRGHPFAAGLIFGICAIKFHLFALVPVVLLALGMWRVIAGGVTFLAGALALSFLSDGWDWPLRYKALLGGTSIHRYPELMPTLYGLSVDLGIPEGSSRLLLVAATLAIVAAVVYVARKYGFEYGVACALLGGLLTAYHAYLADTVVLLPVFALILANSAWEPLRGAVALALLPPLYLFEFAGVPYVAALPFAFIGLLLLACFQPNPTARTVPAVASTGLDLAS